MFLKFFKFRDIKFNIIYIHKNMSYAGYEDIVDSMSGQKPKDDNINFDVGSFDANSSSINQTFQSVKKEDDLIKASHRFSLNNIMITDKKNIRKSRIQNRK